MSEIRTCEDYVVSELLDLREKFEAQNDYINLLRAEIDKMSAAQELIKKELKVDIHSSSYNSLKYISFSGSIWSNEENYDKIRKLLEDTGYDFADEDEGKTE